MALCAEKADARTQLEAAGYNDWMHANVLLLREKFSEAAQRFTSAKYVLASELSWSSFSLFCYLFFF